MGKEINGVTDLNEVVHLLPRKRPLPKAGEGSTAATAAENAPEGVVEKKMAHPQQSNDDQQQQAAFMAMIQQQTALLAQIARQVGGQGGQVSAMTAEEKMNKLMEAGLEGARPITLRRIGDDIVSGLGQGVGTWVSHKVLDMGFDYLTKE